MNRTRPIRVATPGLNGTSGLGFTALLESMPSAQSVASETLHRLRHESSEPTNVDGRRVGVKGLFSASSRMGPRIRFIYVMEDTAPDVVQAYHNLLVEAEVLLDRLFNARSIGLRPVHFGLGIQHHTQTFTRPPRGELIGVSPEYRRWYTEHGSPRNMPLCREELVDELGRLDGLAPGAARAAAKRSWALPKVEQDWLIARAEVEAMFRPLHRDDIDALSRTLEAIVGQVTLTISLQRTVEANRSIAVRTAAVLGSMSDTFTAAPFAVQSLAEAFAAAHAAHLASVASVTSDLTSQKTGMSWFLAKRHHIKAMVARQAHDRNNGEPSSALFESIAGPGRAIKDV